MNRSTSHSPAQAQARQSCRLIAESVDQLQIGRLAHDLKAGSGVFGFEAVQGLAEAIELACREGSLAEALRLSADLEARLEAALASVGHSYQPRPFPTRLF